MARGTEYGGLPGVIQPEEPPEGSLYGHSSRADTAADREGVQEAAMVLRRAGLKEAGGVPASIVETRNDDGTFTIEVTPYDEELAREDLVNGRNT